MEIEGHKTEHLSAAAVARYRTLLREWCVRDRDLGAYCQRVKGLPEAVQAALVLDEKRREPTTLELERYAKTLSAVRLLALLMLKSADKNFPNGDIVNLVRPDNYRAVYDELVRHAVPQAVTADDAIAILRAARSDFQREQQLCPSSP